MYSFGLISKMRFYASYLWYKLVLFRDVKKGTTRIYVAELIWVINQFFLTKIALPDWFKTDYFVTKFGKFYIEPDLVSTIAISPAFEREDISYLMSLIRKEVVKKKKILFIDIGANIGLYSIIVGNAFKDKIKTIAFEPGTSYLSTPSYELLKKNIKKNNLTNITLHKIGIGSTNSKNPNKEGFYTKTLSAVIGKDYFRKFDTVFIKLDVDDYVVDALAGIQECVDSGKNTILLIEDFVDRKCIKILQKNHWQFISKRSTYNSFWKLIH